MPLRLSKDRLAHEPHPCAIFFPRQRIALHPHRNARPPPLRLAHEPGRAAAGGVSRLPHDAEERDDENLRRRAAHQHAPQFISRVAMMRADFISLRAREVVADRERRLLPHLPARRAAAQREVGLFIRVEEKIRVAAEPREDRAPDGRAGVCVRAGKMRRAEIRLRERRWKFIGALRKGGDGKRGAFIEQLRET